MRLFLALTLALFPFRSASAEPCTRAVSTNTPCDGIAVPIEDARRMIHIKEVELPATLIELQHCKDECRAKGEFSAQIIDAQKKQIFQLEEHLKTISSLDKKVEPRPLISTSFVVGIGTGFVVGAGGATALWYLLK